MTYPPQTPPFLVMAQGPWPKHTFPLNKNILSIGRMDDNDIVIDDPGVSRYHARLTRSEGKWILEDLGSSNGTFINGQRIRVPTYLAADSQIGLGPDVLLGVQRGTPAAARPRQKAPRKKSKLPIVGGVLGLGLAGLIVLAVLAVAGYFYFSPAARLPFGLSQTTDENIFSNGPGVVIQQPQPYTQINKGDSLLFSATAVDDSGVIRIDLWVDDQMVLSQSSPDENGITPLSLNYPLVATAEGTYTLVARAYNKQGLMGESLAHSVNVIAGESTASTQNLGQYVVQAGDTLESIARRAGTTVEAILAVNPGIVNGQITPGQVILIPLPQAPPMGAAPQPQPVSGQANGQANGQSSGQQGVQQRNGAAPANPSTAVAVKSATVNPSPVYYGQHCTTFATVLRATAKVEPLADISKVILAYAYIDSAGVRTQDIELEMKLTGGEYKADVNVGKEAETYLAQAGGKLELRVEAYDKNNKLSYSPIYTATVTYCPPQAGGINLPGFVPAAFPDLGNLKVAGQNGLPGVVVNPAPGAVGNPNPRMAAPDPVQITAMGDCQVKITWKDNTTIETHFDIQRRAPGSAFGMNVAVLTANTTEYMDTLPGSGKYEYEVVARQSQGGKIVDYATSRPVIVDVPSTPACQPLPTLMRLIFQPVAFNAPGYAEGFIEPIIAPYAVFRLPRGQGSSIPLADFGSTKYRLETWLPEKQVGQNLIIKVAASGAQANKPPDALGSFAATHTYADLTNGNIDQVYQGKGQGFTFQYKLWLEPYLWGAPQAPPSAVIPAPTNVRVAVNKDSHDLFWDYKDNKARDQYVSGFHVYSEYYCPGHKTAIEWPRVVTKQAGGMAFDPKKLPQGCACSYSVSAFGQGGESQRVPIKNPEDCLTYYYDEKVTVTFKDVEISGQNMPQPRNATIDLWANYFFHTSASEVHLFSGKHNLGQIDFSPQAGIQPGNTPITLQVKTGDALQLGFYIGGTCKSNDLLIKAPAGGSWAGVNQEYTVQSADGGCKVTVHVGNGAAGGQPPANGQNQPPQQAKYGPGCGDTGCSITVYNKTPYTIVGLNFTRQSNNGVENPISQPALVIPANGSLQISEFYDENYTYQAFYGTWAQGQAKPTISGNGPVSPIFAGTSQIIHIFDPKAPPPNANEALLRKLLTTGQQANEFKLMWLFYNKGQGDVMCPTVICNDRIIFYSNGTFDYFEADIAAKVTSGTYKLVSLNPATGVASFDLIPNDNKAKFSRVYYNFNTNVFQSMSLYVDVTTDTYGYRKASFNPQVP